MNDKTRRQVVLLVVLAGLLAALVGYQLWDSGPAATGAVASNPLGAATATDGSEPVTDVRLDLLQQKPNAYTPPQRNPFRFEERPAPVVRRAPAAPPVFVPPVQQPGPPPLPQIRIRYIGHIVTQGGSTVALLRDEASGAQVHARAGDIIDGRYRLLSVSPEAVDVAYLDGRGRQRIVLSGQ